MRFQLYLQLDEFQPTTKKKTKKKHSATAHPTSAMPMILLIWMSKGMRLVGTTTHVEKTTKRRRGRSESRVFGDKTHSDNEGTPKMELKSPSHAGPRHVDGIA